MLFQPRQSRLGKSARNRTGHPYKANEKDNPAFLAKTLYKQKLRSRIDQSFWRLKRFKRIALGCEKTTRNFASIVSFTAGLCLIKFAHTAQLPGNTCIFAITYTKLKLLAVRVEAVMPSNVMLSCGETIIFVPAAV